MDSIKLALIGCGGMGFRHLHGFIELKKCGFEDIELIAVCDLNENNARHVASVAEAQLSIRPKVYTDIDQLLSTEKELNGIDLVTDPISHHTIAVKAFEAKVNVLVEKPMGLTVRACHKMIEAAKTHNCKLGVAENYRRDPMNRLVKALLDQEIIGKPYMALHNSIGGGSSIMSGTTWRHEKVRGGYLLEMGVHFADILRYFWGEVEQIYAETALFETERHRGGTSRFYEHRLVNEPSTMKSTAEDTAVATFRFANGAIGEFILSFAGHGTGLRHRIFYGSKGSLNAPGDRSGNPITVQLDSKEAISDDKVLEFVPHFQLDAATSRLFGFSRVSRYQMPFEPIDHKLLGYEIWDFADAIKNDRSPEVDGGEGMKAVAFSYALCESGLLRAPVKFEDVAQDRVNAYQDEINLYL